MACVVNKNRYKVNDKVWWFDAWGNLRWGIIFGFVDGHAAIYEEGKTGSKAGAKLSDCWPSKDACLNAEKERSEQQTAEYETSIKDVNDLVKFLFTHDLNSEFCDGDAVQAARKRAKELLDLDL